MSVGKFVHISSVRNLEIANSFVACNSLQARQFLSFPFGLQLAASLDFVLASYFPLFVRSSKTYHSRFRVLCSQV